METSIRINPLVSFAYMLVGYRLYMEDSLDDIGVLDHCCELLEIQFPIPDHQLNSSPGDNKLTHPYQPP